MISIALLLVNIIAIIIFSLIDLNQNFYNSLNISSLIIAFVSVVASSFFSFSVYLQTKNQNKINDCLPKKDDQYIIANYSLFNIENEISFFSINSYEKDILVQKKAYLSDISNAGEEITRLVLLPTDSMNKPTYKVMVRSIEFISQKDEVLFSATAEGALDGEYSSNVLLRGYNCICVDVLTSMEKMKDLFANSRKIKLCLDIISVFNVKMAVAFYIYLAEEKNTDNNPDKGELPDLSTYRIHHANYFIEEKAIIISE